MRKIKAEEVLTLIVLFAPMTSIAGEETITVNLPKGTYAFSNFPPCAGLREEAHELMQDPKFQAAVSSANVIAGAVVTAFGEIDRLSSQHGGELSKLWRNAVGGSSATCGTVTFVLPKSTELREVRLSNRNGGEPWAYPFRETERGFYNDIVSRVDRQDWSGWLDVSIYVVKQRYVVLATAVNWQHNAGTNQTMKVVWDDL